MEAWKYEEEKHCINRFGPASSILGSQWSSTYGVARDGLEESLLQAYGSGGKKKCKECPVLQHKVI